MTGFDLANLFEKSYFKVTESAMFDYALSLEAKTQKLDEAQFRSLIEGDTIAQARWPVLNSLISWLVTEECLHGLPDWSEWDENKSVAQATSAGVLEVSMKTLTMFLLVGCSGQSVKSLADASSSDTSYASPPDARSCTMLLVAGQSNAAGLGPSQGLPSALSQPLEGTYEAHLGTLNDPPSWVDYGPGPFEPLHYNGGYYFGVEMSLSASLGPSHRVLKTAISGSTLAVNWNANGTFPRVGPNLANETFALAAERKHEWGCDRVEVVWIQGESDAARADYADAYQQRLTEIVALSRTYLPGVRWAIGRLNSGTSEPYTSVVQAAQENYVASDPDSILVDQDSALLGYDHLHYTAAGYVTLGDLYAEVLR